MKLNEAGTPCMMTMTTLLAVAACGDIDGASAPPEGDPTTADTSAEAAPTLEELKAATLHTGGQAPVYLIEGDILMNEAQLALYHRQTYGDEVEKASVARVNGTTDTVWAAGERTNITYCVADSFGNSQSRAIADMSEAVSQWMSAADVAFVYVPGENDACSASNTSVDLNVIPGTAGGAGCYPHACRYLEMNYGADFGRYTWLGAWTHEVGHTLGLAHEHIRAPCNQGEGLTVRTLTDYDINSSMHYDTLCGSDSNGQMTELDRAGLASLYTAPASTALRVTPASWVMAVL